MKIIEGDLIMEEDMIFEDSLKVIGNIRGKDGGRFNLTVKGDLKCWNLNCRNLTFYAVAVAYNSFKCKTWKARRENYIIKCLDGEIEGEELTNG